MPFALKTTWKQNSNNFVSEQISQTNKIAECTYETKHKSKHINARYNLKKSSCCCSSRCSELCTRRDWDDIVINSMVSLLLLLLLPPPLPDELLR